MMRAKTRVFAAALLYSTALAAMPASAIDRLEPAGGANRSSRPIQRVRGDVAAPVGPTFLAGETARSMCDLVDATVNWATRQRVPCERVPVTDLCAEPGALRGRREMVFRFRVDRRTRGGLFELRPAEDGADLKIVFEGDRRVHIDRSYLDGSTGEERGRVPRGATKASVCLVVGTPTAFTYLAWPPAD